MDSAQKPVAVAAEDVAHPIAEVAVAGVDPMDADEAADAMPDVVAVAIAHSVRTAVFAKNAR